MQSKAVIPLLNESITARRIATIPEREAAFAEARMALSNALLGWGDDYIRIGAAAHLVAKAAASLNRAIQTKRQRELWIAQERAVRLTKKAVEAGKALAELQRVFPKEL